MARTEKTVKYAWILLGLLLVLCGCSPAPKEVPALQYTKELTLEAGSPLPQASDFVPEEGEDKSQVRYAGELTEVSSDVPGTYQITLVCREQEYPAVIRIVDTVAPTGTALELTRYSYEELPAAEEFVEHMEDVTAVTVSYLTEPSMKAVGSQVVTLVLTDTSGNATQLQTTLTVLRDEVAPEITGVHDIETYVGDAVSYRTGVSVTDDLDPNPTLTIKSEQVDLTTPGVYEVEYVATDRSGNTVSQKAKVTVYEKTAEFEEPEVIYAKADSVLGKIITEDMTQREKVERIYCWVRMHVTYSYSYHNPSQGDWLQSANDAFIKRTGDCYSFFALNKLLLQRAGISTIDVEKVRNHAGDSMHYWLLVSIDDGQTYYHLDNVWSWALCLVTDRELNAFSAQYRNCFNRDTSLYPATPDERLPQSELPWNDPILINTQN